MILKIKNILTGITLICIATILVSIVNSKFIKKEKIVNIFGKSILVVMTGSMEPYIAPGEMIIISKDAIYETGDVITFIEEDSFVTHRIVSLNNERIITKGDANNIEDDPICKEQVVGKVIFKSKLLGHIILNYLKIICVLYCIFAFMHYIVKIIKNGEKDG